MTNNNGFFNFLTTGAEETKGNVKANSNTNKGGYTSKPSQGQIKYYNDLCNQRNIKPESIEGWTFEKMSETIGELLKFKPASPKQLELIKEKVTKLTQLGKEVQVPQSLTGGLDGTASKFIGELIEMEKEFADLDKPSDKQLEMILGMYLCPSVNFEDYDINKKIVINGLSEDEMDRLDVLTAAKDKGVWSELPDGNWGYIQMSAEQGKELDSLEERLENTQWRLMTPLEFKKELTTKLNKKQASELIDKNRGAFYDWKNTRVRPEQMKYIKTLEERLSYQYKPRTIEYAVDENGETIEVDAYGSESISGTEYTPMTDDQIIMLSVEDADTFINQLKSELERKEGSTLIEEYTDQNIRGSRNQGEALEIEYKAFHDLMYKLMAVVGYEDEELVLAASKGLVSDHTHESQAANREYIREFMVQAIADGAITFNQIIELTSESETAQKILLGL